MELLISVIGAMLTLATPLLFAALGEILTERSGVINLGLEGLMLVGALTGAVTTIATGAPFIGLAAAFAAGMLLAAIHGFAVIERAGAYRTEYMILMGLMIVLLGIGLTKMLGRDYVNVPVRGFQKLSLGELPAWLPDWTSLLLRAVFEHSILVPLALAVAVLMHLGLREKGWSWGLRVSMAGENPLAAESVGINVRLTRWVCVLIGGGLAAVGGSALTIEGLSTWQSGIAVGKGWIAIGLVVFSGWQPLRAITGALLFGGVLALIPRAQLLGWIGSSYFLATIPYLTVIFAAAFMFKSRRGVPAALAKPFTIERRN